MAEPMVQDRVRERTAPAQTHAAPAVALGAESGTHWLLVGFERVALGILTTLVSVNIWTGGPLFALWVGSRIQSAVGSLSMAAVGATLGVLIVVTFLLYKALALLNTRYNRVTGRVVPRQQAAWLKPMSGERRSIEVKRPLSAIERIVIASVVVAVLAFEIWFLFFAHYSFAG